MALSLSKAYPLNLFLQGTEFFPARGVRVPSALQAKTPMVAVNLGEASSICEN